MKVFLFEEFSILNPNKFYLSRFQDFKIFYLLTIFANLFQLMYCFQNTKDSKVFLYSYQILRIGPAIMPTSRILKRFSKVESFQRLVFHFHIPNILFNSIYLMSLIILYVASNPHDYHLYHTRNNSIMLNAFFNFALNFLFM